MYYILSVGNAIVLIRNNILQMFIKLWLICYILRRFFVKYYIGTNVLVHKYNTYRLLLTRFYYESLKLKLLFIIIL